MACNCSDYVDCHDPSVTIATYDETAGYTHTVNNTKNIDFWPSSYLEKTERTFAVDYGWDREIVPGYIIEGYCSDTIPRHLCGRDMSAKAHCNVGESCHRETIIPYYLDRQRDLFLYKHTVEDLKFDLDSGGKVAAFKLKFGNGYFHKICIPEGTKTDLTEKFVLVKNGEAQTILEGTTQYDPFPLDGPGGTWGLYGDHVIKDNPPDTPNVRLILLFPNPPKLGIPLDNDVIHYGFYDYNATEGGFIETGLPADDGGKDYFYPYWCRKMNTDALWRSTADKRYSVIYSQGTMNLAGRSTWYGDDPQVYPYPFASFAVDSKDHFIDSLLLHLSGHFDAKGKIVNNSSVGDLYDAIFAKNKIIPGQYWDIFPVAPK